jgi:hypothetical protein
MPDPVDPPSPQPKPFRAQSVIAARSIRAVSWCLIWLAVMVPMLAVLRILGDTVSSPTGDGLWIFGTAVQILINGKTFVSGAIPILPGMIAVALLTTAADQRPSYVTALFGAAWATIAVKVGTNIYPETELRFVVPLLKIGVIGGALGGFAADRLARLTALSIVDPTAPHAKPARGSAAIAAVVLVGVAVSIWSDLWSR